MSRFPAVLLVWLGCCLAWIVLGTSLVARTGETSQSLKREVQLLWGPALVQHRPGASVAVPRVVRDTETRKGSDGRLETLTHEKTVMDQRVLPLTASRLKVHLALEHRRKGLLWFPTYAVDFRGRYSMTNDADTACVASLALPLGDENGLFDGFRVVDDAGEERPVSFEGNAAHWPERFAPRETRSFTVSYRSRGTSSWTYPLAEGASRVSDFHLEITTNFARVDFPAGSISPSSHRTTPAGWEGRWDFDRLVANAPIGIELPEKLNPGPLASRITFFAPVGLLFFFFVVALVSESRAHGIHPMNYFFFGCAFFAFHLLFAYLVDHVAILPSFAIAALVSIGLVVSYARLFTPASFAARVIGGAQLIYLVMFSATFFWEGFTGLSISVGAVLTLFVMMQLTGRTDWRRTAATPAAAPAGAS